DAASSTPPTSTSSPARPIRSAPAAPPPVLPDRDSRTCAPGGLTRNTSRNGPPMLRWVFKHLSLVGSLQRPR
uniref:Uncharacterized protein n=2 Tax=Ixodes scapularis TaxID=6945 RepID=A0A1S4LJU9_IXOSC